MIAFLRAWLRRYVAARYHPVPCPYCTNPDRNSVFDNWRGCAWQIGRDGGDPPCVLDGWASNRQLGRLGMHN